MRFPAVLLNDIRFQVKYGFYFLYAFFSLFYIAILYFCPGDYKDRAASIIVLSDPAMLGSFFIGGIWLLEKGEGLHGFWAVSPIRPAEYTFSKAVSLGLISTLAAACIILAGGIRDVRFPVLIVSVFLGSMIFTVLGLLIASYARSVNHYMLLVVPLQIAVLVPPVLAVFGFTSPILGILPGMALWQIICYSIGMAGDPGIVFPVIILAVWLGAAFFLAGRRIPAAIQAGEGGSV